MTNDELLAKAREAGFNNQNGWLIPEEKISHFAALIEAPLKARIDQWASMYRVTEEELEAARQRANAAESERDVLRARLKVLDGHRPTEEMVTAYLNANDAYWRESDQFTPPPGSLRKGTARQATWVSLRAALAPIAAPQDHPTQEKK